MINLMYIAHAKISYIYITITLNLLPLNYTEIYLLYNNESTRSEKY